MNTPLSFLFWDPSREMFPFQIPFLGRSILWYGFFFALGFFLGYWVLRALLKSCFQGPAKQVHAKVVSFSERMTLWVIIGAVVGARIGDLLFYQQWSEILHDPLIVIRVWQGGLASHGGVLGILCALFVLSRRTKKEFSWLRLVDLTAIPAALGGTCIRVGNFFNQEILGKATNLPWAVIFGHPADGSAAVPRHPVQLYESVFYLITFFLLYALWKYLPAQRKEGRTTGLFLILVFGFRFCIEFLKVEQSVLISPHSFFTMGQYLSVPFIVLGIILMFRKAPVVRDGCDL
jgi:prolipoprotein diacylglyceryl transferase